MRTTRTRVNHLTAALRFGQFTRLDGLPENLADLDLTGYEADDLAGLLSDAEAAFDGVLDDVGDGIPTAEQNAELTRLRDVVLAARGENERRTSEAQAAAADVAQLRRDVHGDQPAEGEGGEGADAEGAEGANAEDRETVTAGGARPSLGNLGGDRPQGGGTTRTRAPQLARPTLLASAGASGFTSGQEITLSDASTILDQRRRAMPQPGSKGRHIEGIVALRRQFDESMTASAGMSLQETAALLDRAGDETRLEGGSLQASGSLTAAGGGGWCAPSVQLYDVPDDGATAEGLVDIPEINVERGGVKWFPGIDWSTAWGNRGFVMTEAQAIAGDLKPVIDVDCPDDIFEERLDPIGQIIRSKLLSEIGFPEYQETFVGMAQLAHERLVSYETARRMVAKTTDVKHMPATQSAAVSLLNFAELNVEDLKGKRVRSRATTFEGLAPFWIRPVIRADLAKRNGFDNPFDVTDAMIDKWFADRGIRMQYTYDWQYLTVDPVANGAVGDAAIRVGNGSLQWPASVSILMYPTGTFVRGRQHVLTVNGIYDQDLLRANEKLALFTEDAILVAKRGFDSRLLTVDLSVDGVSAIQAEMDNARV